MDYLKLDNCYDEGIPPKQRYPISVCRACLYVLGCLDVLVCLCGLFEVLARMHVD